MRKTASESEIEAPAPPPAFLESRDLPVALLAGAFALLVYGRTLAPTITGEDSGELIGAAFTLGIPHPPGYPLWTMIAHAFTWIPVGSVAWRVNLMSAVFGAGSVTLLCLIAQGLSRNRVAALFAALAFAFSLEFWRQAVIAEVYTLNVFLFALCLLLLLQWQCARRDCLLLLFAAVYGMSLANHNTMHVMGPCFALFILAVERPRPDRFAFYALLLFVAFGIALLLYAYLPFRSLRNPAVDWGNPETLGKWWAVVTRKQYSFMFSQFPRGVDRSLEQILALLGLAWQQFTPAVGAACLVGLALLLWRRFWLALWLLGAAALVLAAFAFMQNFNLDKEWLWVMRVFGLPAYFVAALGLETLLQAMHSRVGRIPVAVLGLTFVLLPLTSHWKLADKSEFFWVDDYARNTFLNLPREAIYFPEGDHASFSALYLQSVEGLRPDVHIARKYGYLDVSGFPELRAEYGEFPKKRHDTEIIQRFLALSDRPVFLQGYRHFPRSSGLRTTPAGLLFRVLRPGESQEQPDPWENYTWHTLNPEKAHGDYTAEAIYCEIYFARALRSIDAGIPAKALGQIERGLLIFGRDYASLNNAGVLCARKGLRRAARTYFEETLAKAGADKTAAQNLERLGPAAR